MPVVGVITCEILELEFAYLLSRDPDIAGVTVVEDATSFGFIEALESMGRFEPRTIPDAERIQPGFQRPSGGFGAGSGIGSP